MVDLKDETLANGDGLVLNEQTLYVVLQQPDTEIVVVKMADDFASGTVVFRVQDELLAPATAIKVDERLLVIHAV